jgi:hypothetical protein
MLMRRRSLRKAALAPIKLAESEAICQSKPNEVENHSQIETSDLRMVFLHYVQKPATFTQKTRLSGLDGG